MWLQYHPDVFVVVQHTVRKETHFCDCAVNIAYNEQLTSFDS